VYSHSLRGDPFFTWSGVLRPVQFALTLSALILFSSLVSAR
jgi:hypothetical protein